MKKIIHCFNATVPRPKVFAALTTEEGLSSWWSTKVKTDGSLGSIVEFTFLADFNPHMKIVTLDGPGLLEWKCVGGHEPWADSRFRFALKETDGGTEIMFTQEGLRPGAQRRGLRSLQLQLGVLSRESETLLQGRRGQAVRSVTAFRTKPRPSSFFIA